MVSDTVCRSRRTRGRWPGPQVRALIEGAHQSPGVLDLMSFQRICPFGLVSQIFFRPVDRSLVWQCPVLLPRISTAGNSGKQIGELIACVFAYSSSVGLLRTHFFWLPFINLPATYFHPHLLRFLSGVFPIYDRLCHSMDLPSRYESNHDHKAKAVSFLFRASDGHAPVCHCCTTVQPRFIAVRWFIIWAAPTS